MRRIAPQVSTGASSRNSPRRAAPRTRPAHPVTRRHRGDLKEHRARGDVLALKERESVIVARSIDTSAHRIVRRHILPNVLSPILVSAKLGTA